jgi:hypothetical protein
VRKMICDGAPPVVIVQADLVAARIRRKNPSLSREAAHELTAELDNIIAYAIACARKRLWAAEPGFSADDERELIQVMTYAIIEDNNEESSAASDHEYLVGMLTDTENSVDLYPRYMRLFDRINGTNMVGDFDLDGSPAKKQKPELCLVRDDIPSLDAIMQALVAAVRLAQSGKGPTKILDLLPAFKESVELDFIMKATEAHRGALFDLVQNAGIPVKKEDSK